MLCRVSVQDWVSRLHSCQGFRVAGTGYRVQGSGFRVQGPGFTRGEGVGVLAVVGVLGVPLLDRIRHLVKVSRLRVQG